MSTVSVLRPRPAGDFGAASRRFEALQARDGADIIAAGRSVFLGHGARTPLAVVLLHGLTNAPQQWLLFGGELHVAGHTVVIPRLPGHGHAERSGRALRQISGRELLERASEAVDIAAGAGQRVVLAGLSLGGGLAAQLAFERDDIGRSIPIVPLFGLKQLGAAANGVLRRALRVVPNFRVRWDPAEVPPYGYFGFPSRFFAETLQVGCGAYDASASIPPRAQLALLLNSREPAISNVMALDFSRRVGRVRAGAVEVTVLDDLPPNHDIIDPTNRRARVDLVYPVLRRLIEA